MSRERPRLPLTGPRQPRLGHRADVPRSAPVDRAGQVRCAVEPDRRQDGRVPELLGHLGPGEDGAVPVGPGGHQQVPGLRLPGPTPGQVPSSTSPRNGPP
ncbi:hypothetical protein G3I34_00540 [Streptomyces sp. SID8014]|uniref:hypothetical protein n=1 Tax=Streptomyces sp. SID8014 TaxID=2706097 RepID=UPI0013B79743|nr:hypothetical protein [Streptomyces sp. SID8014]NEC10823.1 hypothetical protein [Streptomyces sp. SID8014]